MVYTSCVAVLLSLELVSQTPAKAASAWVAVESKEGGFSFSMPGKPAERIMQVPGPNPNLKAKTYVCAIGESGFVVQQVTLPSPIPPDEVAAQYQQGKNAVIEPPQLVSEKRIKSGNVVGLEFVKTGPMGPDKRNRTIKAHVFLNGSVGCTMLVVSGPDKPLPPEADRFLESVRFGGGPAAVPRPQMAANSPAPPSKRKPLAKIDLVDKTPEDALRTFMMAMAAADEKTLRAVTLPNNDLDVLLTGEAPPFGGVKEMKQQIQKMKIERLKEGDRVNMPGNKVHIVRVTEVGRDRAALLPEDAPFPTRLRLVSGHWKVDAGPVIAARKAASSASRKAGTN